MAEFLAISGQEPLITNRSFREYRVVARHAESAVICSLVLEPADGAPVSRYKPGQYLIFRFQLNGQSVLRHYSVSSYSESPEYLRISVKHEKAPIGQSVPDGVGSSFLHTEVQVGDILSAVGPVGEFTLSEDSTRPVVLMSGGVGVTPLLSMLHRLARSSQRPVYFIHACENGSLHAFADEVLALAAQREGVQVYFCYRTPSLADTQSVRHQASGLLTREQLQSWLPLDDYECYLCGPSGFMQSNYGLLRSLGVVQERIHYEFFGPATVLEETLTHPETLSAVEAVGGVAPEVVCANEEQTVASASSAQVVTFLPDGHQAVWHEECESLLVLAEEAGCSPDYNCRSGLCNTCMCTLESGEVYYFEEPLDRVPEGKVLLCCARPKGAVVVNLG